MLNAGAGRVTSLLPRVGKPGRRPRWQPIACLGVYQPSGLPQRWFRRPRKVARKVGRVLNRMPAGGAAKVRSPAGGGKAGRSSPPKC
jgi:hypothetical protein